MKPSVGRVVHYITKGTGSVGCLAAIVNRVGDDPSEVGLSVFDPNFGYLNINESYLDPAGPTDGWRDGHWHWPERVDG